MVIITKALLALVAIATMVIIMARPSIQHKVHVTNKLSDKVLIVHCRSKDDDLGAHALPINGSVGWEFEPHAFSATLFWCNLAVKDKRLSFVAFSENEGYTKHWYVRDDGVYGKKRYTPKVFWKAAWSRVSPTP